MVSSLLCLVALFVSAVARHKLVMYWGCDNPLNAGHAGFKDLPLAEFCDRGTYDIIQLAFLDSFLDARTKQPHLHLHKHHCNTTFKGTDSDPNVGLIHCPDVANQIKHCQRKGIKVGLSCGGGVGDYYFTSDAEAKEAAHTLWEMFFVPGTNGTLRPFDDAVLDGIGLDIEGGSGVGYQAFLEEFHGLVQTYDHKPIYIAAAPQCTAAADGHIGFMWKIISEGARYFTHIWPQFYNNYCYYPSQYNGAQWQSALQSLNPSIKWYSGIPASPDAGGGFVGGSVGGLVAASRGFSNWDGIMMWDASWDQYNGWYSDTVRSALGGGPPPPPIPTPPPTPLPPPTPPTPDCHSVSPHATDAWCMMNCHWTPPNCPENLCKCDDDDLDVDLV